MPPPPPPPLFDPAALVAELAVYLDMVDSIDEERAEQAIRFALKRASAIVSPVPEAALPIIMDVAGRGYNNAQGAASEQVGPFQRTFHFPGVYLTSRERADLRSLAGRGGAFTINPLGVDG